MKLRILVFLALLQVGCVSKVYRQAGSDALVLPVPPDKAVVVLDAEAGFGASDGVMLVGYARLVPGKSMEELYNAKEWEFATYPGAIIPGYAGKNPHQLQAYLLEPGQYAIVRCVFGAPEADYCLEGVWMEKGRTRGMAYFEVLAGDVITPGRLSVSRESVAFAGDNYRLQISDNSSAAKAYLDGVSEELGARLSYRPYRFTW
jgi:hypothetical protein